MLRLKASLVRYPCNSSFFIPMLLILFILQPFLYIRQVQAAGKVDIMMIPVGGTYTINAAEARTVVNQVKPRIIIPMHFRTPPLNLNMTAKLGPVDDFLKVMGPDVTVNRPGHSLTVESGKLPEKQTVIVLYYRD